MLHASIEQEFLEISQIQKETYLPKYLFIKVCLTLKRLEGDQFDTHHSCGFSKNVFFQRKGGFLVFCDSFNIFISHIFHENFIEIPQLVQKIWWHQHMASAIIYLQPTLNKLINNCIKIYWYHISSSWNLLLLLLPGAAGGTGGEDQIDSHPQKKLPSKSPVLLGLQANSLKGDSNTSVFLWILQTFLKNLLYRIPSDDCFWEASHLVFCWY